MVNGHQSETGGASAPAWFDRTVGIARSYLAILLLYVASMTALLWGLARLQEPAAQLFGGNRILPFAIAGVPLFACVLFHAVPAGLQRVRQHRLTVKGIQATFERPRYFRIAPYQNTQEDRTDFDRADNAHVEIADWLENTSLGFLYLTGLSGTGKSSLINAYLLPLYGNEDAPFLCFALPRARAFQRFRFQLLETGRIWRRPPTDVESIHEILQRACEHIAPRRLLLIIDQFEEYLIQRSRPQGEESPFDQLIGAIREKPIPGLVILVALRSDFKGLLDEFRSDFGLPRMQDNETWKEVAPFTERSARQFLKQSPLDLGERLLAEVFRQLSELEDRPGLFRPIALNMVGLVLDRSAISGSKRLPMRRSAEGFLADYVRSCLRRSDMKGVGPQVAKQLVSSSGLPKIVSVDDIAAVTELPATTVTGCLLTLAEQGLARELDVRERLWEPSHDFVARLLGRVLATWRQSLALILRRGAVAASLVGWIFVFLIGPAATRPGKQLRWYEQLSVQEIRSRRSIGLYLHRAVKDGATSLAATKYLVDQGIDIEKKDPAGRSAASVCAEIGNVECLRYLLERGCDIESPDRGHNSLLDWAAAAEQPAIAELLLRHNADVESRDMSKWTPLIQACTTGSTAVAKVLLDHGVSTQQQGPNGETPLHYAANGGYVDIIRLLVKRDATIDARDGQGKTPMHIAVEARQAAAVEALLDLGAGTQEQGPNGGTPLHYAASLGYVDLIQLLVERDATIDARDGQGKTPLQIAVEARQAPAAVALLDLGASPASKDRFGNSAIHVATAGSLSAIVAAILDHDPKAALIQDDAGQTPLHIAATNAEPEVVKLLLDAGADLEARALNGATPLGYAALADKPVVLKLLLEQGANVAALDGSGYAPLHFAAVKGNATLVRLLLDKGAQIDRQGMDGNTPLHFAAQRGHAEVVELLLKKGARTDLKNVAGLLPRDLAEQNGHEEIAAKLTE